MDKALLIIVFFFLLIPRPWSQNCLNPSGEWKNQSGSALTIDSIADSGLIYGNYRSHEGTEGQRFPVTGWWNRQGASTEKTVVSFTVYWKPYQTITSWTGYCHLKSNEIHTLWHHIDTDTRFEFQEWSAQSSVFKAVEP